MKLDKNYGIVKKIASLGLGLYMFFMSPQSLKEHYTFKEYLRRVDNIDTMIIDSYHGKISRDEVLDYIFKQIKFFEENKPEYKDDFEKLMWRYLQESEKTKKGKLGTEATKKEKLRTKTLSSIKRPDYKD